MPNEKKSNNEINESNKNLLYNTIIYATDSTNLQKNELNTCISGDYDCLTVEYEDISYDKIPEIFQDVRIISIPKGIRRELQRAIPLKMYDKIHKDRTIAMQKCLLVISFLTSTLFKDEKWKSLSSKVLHEATQHKKDNTRVYKEILNVLKYSSAKHQAIFEVKLNSLGTETYTEKVECKKYKLHDRFHNRDLEVYKIENFDIIEKRRKYYFKKLNQAYDNIIARNLLKLYESIELPTLETIIAHSKELVKKKYCNKKGKRITFLNNMSRTKIKNVEERFFVEDSLKNYNYLTATGFKIPIIGTENAGFRVYDSLSLCPGFIRSLLTIDGEKIVELDFKALHPNLAIKIYGGNSQFLSHQKIAAELHLDLLKVKKAHLSFFNYPLNYFLNSPLHKYYHKNETEMLDRLILDKQINGYKITSKKMFALEVKIMTECIRRLNKKEIYVGYTYDALFCKKSEEDIIKRIMNEVVLEHGVYTIAD